VEITNNLIKKRSHQRR